MTKEQILDRLAAIHEEALVLRQAETFDLEAETLLAEEWINLYAQLRALS